MEEVDFQTACSQAEKRSEYIANQDGSFFSQSDINPEDIAENFTYEGLAAIVFADMFVDANKDYLLELTDDVLSGRTNLSPM